MRCSRAPLSWPTSTAAVGGVGFPVCVSKPHPSPFLSQKARLERGGLRVLAIFSLPDDQHPLNLRRERYRLERLLEQIAQTRGEAIETRVIQYGATRDTLQDALEEARGWDVIHFSGHGLEGELALEKEDGQLDLITTGELRELLQLAKSRVKLIALSACLSGATTVQAAKGSVGAG